MIEIRAFDKKGNIKQDFFNSIDGAVSYASELAQAGYNVYCGVNPRMQRNGKKESIEYVGMMAPINLGLKLKWLLSLD